ncbi:aspartyl protease family protein [Pontibacter cellulosilyticus]|uniref:Aspartyl protease family protein n=1 Tax=Pontibacter cellulosilyticus TaxID=1720253 RepID=A0A923N3F6_9BACT|nr:aspartyl protease family protein [Pontibacter cellulosilyticus]MBC5991768.1 aspartyl protease family protein [Pontibacter cellulosilyticus]
MTKAGFLTLLCLVFFLLPEFVSAQVQPKFEHDTVYFTSKRKNIKLPFKLVHNLIIIPVKINDSQSLNFILDSGVRNTLITRLYYSDSLNLKSADKVAIRGLGSGHDIEALYSGGNTMQMKGIQGDNHQVYVLMEDVFNLSHRMGMPVHGIIGYDIFKNFIVKINYSTKTLTLYRPDVKLKKKRKAEEFPLHIEETKAYVYGKVHQQNGDTLQVKLVLDTGASHTVSLYLPTNERLSLPPKVMEAYLGRGLGGDIHGKIGRLNAFVLGKYELPNLPASYPDEEAIRPALKIANRNGNLGSDVLNRFTVILDYPHNKLTLIPNSKFKEPFNYNLAGFEISTPLPGTNLYIVSNVTENTPAKKVGIETGDQILSINGVECKDMLLPEILDMIDSRPGRKIRMRLKREHKVFDVNFVLQSRI